VTGGDNAPPSSGSSFHASERVNPDKTHGKTSDARNKELKVAVRQNGSGLHSAMRENLLR